MGLSGCGKTTVAKLLAQRTGGLFLDEDDYYSPEAKTMIAAGIPLSDGHRWPWLACLNRALQIHSTQARTVFLACSALRQSYREKLAQGLDSLQFIYLQGSKELIWHRLESRTDHFTPRGLLYSQFATLEEPLDAVTISIDMPIDIIVNMILKDLGT